MNFIDRFISYLSPSAGLERRKARMQLEASYKGGLSTRLSESWGTAQGFRFGTSGERQQIANAVQRAYQAYNNNPVAKTLVDTETDDVIGDGLNYSPMSSSEEWNKEAKDKYYQWLESANVRGGDILSGCQLERTLWGQSRVAGDIGWILESFGNESRIQIVPRENICTPDGSYADPSIYDGVKYDGMGRPLTFYVLSADERGKRQFRPIEARDFVFLPHMTSPMQARGVTAYMSVFDHLDYVSRYVEGVATAAWMGTVFGLIIKETTAAAQIAGLPTITNSQGDAQAAFTMENGMLKLMGETGQVVQVDAKQPMQHTPQFIVSMMRFIGMPFRMPIERLMLDLSTCNFASARIGLIPYYRNCRFKAAHFGHGWGRTIFWWLSREKNRPEGDPKKWKTAFPADYGRHELLMNSFEYTDPVSEVQSDMMQVEAGFKSVQMVIAERGRDGEAIITQRQEWRTKTAGLPECRSSLTRDVADTDKSVEFKQKAWLGFQADGTVADVAANLTDIKQLTEDVGLPVNAEYTEPYLPVVAEAGPLVTGETITDSEGDIVGGDVEELEPAPAANGEGQGDEEQGEGEDGGEESQDAMKVAALAGGVAAEGRPGGGPATAKG